MRITLQEDLDRLEAAQRREGDLVLRALRAAIAALQRQDIELANEVIAFDDEIDAEFQRIQQAVQTLLARQTPVAVDLRLVLALLHINLHLERMGDSCVTIAKLTKLLPGLTENARVLEIVAEMGMRAEEMLRVALDSFSARDAERAATLVDLDELLDTGNRRIVEEMIESGGDASLREWGLRMIIVSRSLERFGDHVVDVGEQTAYLVTGEFREFTDASRTLDERRG